MHRTERIYEKLICRIKKEHPKFKVVLKKNSLLMRFLNVFIGIFNKEFMIKYVTTIGSTVYIPSLFENNVEQLWSTFAHEWIHMNQEKKQGFFIHMFLYLFPQILSIFSLFSLLAIWFSNWWLCCLLFLVSLAPWPAYWRMEKEFKAYMMDVYITETVNKTTDVMTDVWISQFTGPFYYYMWPFGVDLKSRFISEITRIRFNLYDNKPVFKDVLEIMIEADNERT